MINLNRQCYLIKGISILTLWSGNLRSPDPPSTNFHDFIEEIFVANFENLVVIDPRAVCKNVVVGQYHTKGQNWQQVPHCCSQWSVSAPLTLLQLLVATRPFPEDLYHFSYLRSPLDWISQLFWSLVLRLLRLWFCICSFSTPFYKTIAPCRDSSLFFINFCLSSGDLGMLPTSQIHNVQTKYEYDSFLNQCCLQPVRLYNW